MRGILAKRIHAMQAGIPQLTWPKARKMYAELMDIDLTGHGRLKPVNDDRYQRAKKSRADYRKKFGAILLRFPSHNRSEGHPVPQPISTVRSLVTCGGVRPGATKVHYRTRYIRRHQRLAMERIKQGDENPLVSAYKKMVAKFTGMLTKSKQVTQPVSRGPRGRG